jgi:hypothetical protein
MSDQNYLLVQENVVTNVVYWNGDVNTWQPPSDATMLIAATTPAIVWQPVIVNNKITDYVLTEITGLGNIGFTWNGTVVTTNEPKPEIPPEPVPAEDQPATKLLGA